MRAHITFALLLIVVGLVLVVASLRPFSFLMLAIGVVVTFLGGQEIWFLRKQRF